MTNPTKELERYKRLARESAAEKAKSDALFASIGDGAIATDHQGKITRINGAALRLLGRDASEESSFIGAVFAKTIIATDERGQSIPYAKRPINRALTTNQTVSTRCYYQRQDGSLSAVFVTVAPIMLDAKAVGAIEVFRDITEELNIERTKSEFISLASHQLRTPATIVKNYLNLLLDNYAGDLSPQQRYLASVAYESNERQISIVNDLLSVANTEAASLVLKPSRIDLARLVCDVAELLSGMIVQRQQTLTLHLPSALTVTADPSYVKMAIENLLSNASKYTPVGGAIGVDLRHHGSEVVLSVADTGVGIDLSQHQEKLFKKFSRIENELSTEVGGSGIGLYLLKQIVDLHRGSVEVSSHPQTGSIFSVLLPQEAE